MDNSAIQLPNEENRSPADFALDWLLNQNLQPGDIVILEDLDRAMGLVDPETLSGRKDVTRWALTRLPIFQQTVDRFEAETGEILLSIGRGRLVVVDHDEVAQSLFEPAYAQVLKILARALGRIAQATTNDISREELMRRNQATDKITNIRSFMKRERRRRISD